MPEEKGKNDSFRINCLIRPADFDMGGSHYHPYYEMYYLVSGRCRMFINHTIYYMNPGDMALILPSQLHRAVYGDTKNVKRYIVCFTQEYVSYFTESSKDSALAEIFSCPRQSISSAFRPELEQLLCRMEQEKDGRDGFSRLSVQTMLFQLLIFLARSRSNVPSLSPQKLDPGDEAIQEAARYIHRCHRESVTLESAARIAHMSPTYFSKKFKQVTGFGFREYLTQVRIQESLKLLSDTRLSVTQVALACGFSDGNYFGDVFKRMKGISPNQYRKNQKLLKLSDINLPGISVSTTGQQVQAVRVFSETGQVK